MQYTASSSKIHLEACIIITKARFSVLKITATQSLKVNMDLIVIVALSYPQGEIHS